MGVLLAENEEEVAKGFAEARLASSKDTEVNVNFILKNSVSIGYLDIAEKANASSSGNWHNFNTGMTVGKTFYIVEPRKCQLRGSHNNS